MDPDSKLNASSKVIEFPVILNGFCAMRNWGSKVRGEGKMWKEEANTRKPGSKMKKKKRERGRYLHVLIKIEYTGKPQRALFLRIGFIVVGVARQNAL